MKKILSVVLALTMIAALGLTAFAAAGDAGNVLPGDINTTYVKTSTTDENGNSGETFEVTIPATTFIDWGYAEAVDIAGFDITAQLEWNHVLNVTVAGTGKMTFTTTGLTENKTYELPYTLGGALAYNNLGPVVEAADFTGDLTATVDAAEWAKVPVAEYQDTLTFTAEIVNAA